MWNNSWSRISAWHNGGRVKTASEANKIAKGVLEHFPRLRRIARNAVWKKRGAYYRSLTEGIAPDDKTIFFESYGGRSYACSPKAIYEALLQDSRFDGYKMIWSFEEGSPHDDVPKLDRAEKVVRGSDDYLRAIAGAGYWILNGRIPEQIYPREGQTYLQCWHGTPLKRLGYDIVEGGAGALNTADELAARFGLDAAKQDYLISPSPFATQHLSTAFGLDRMPNHCKVIEQGYPRNDAIVNAMHAPDGGAAQAQATREQLGIPTGRKVLLFAPTWRDDEFDPALGYTYTPKLDLKAMRAELGDSWCVLYRSHYYISNYMDFSQFDDFVVDVSKVDDVNELYIASDALLTDYSSVFFDFSCTRRPMLFYPYDLDHYVHDLHGFYFDYSEVPGPACISTGEVIDALKTLPEYDGKYGKRYGEFVKTFCPLDDGRASQRVIKRLFEL